MILTIQDHPDYEITEYGEVISCKNKGYRVLLPDCSNGYPRVTLDGEKRYLADIVAEYFLKPKPDPKYKLFYIDGNKLNCRANNLVWLSESDIKRYSQYTPEYRIQVLGEWA